MLHGPRKRRILRRGRCELESQIPIRPSLFAVLLVTAENSLNTLPYSEPPGSPVPPPNPPPEPIPHRPHRGCRAAKASAYLRLLFRRSTPLFLPGENFLLLITTGRSVFRAFGAGISRSVEEAAPHRFVHLVRVPIARCDRVMVSPNKRPFAWQPSIAPHPRRLLRLSRRHLPTFAGPAPRLRSERTAKEKRVRPG